MVGPESPQTIVVFDGICHLCNAFVDFAISRDRRRHLAFAPAQGSTAASLLPEDLRKALTTVIVVDRGEIFTESKAVARVLIALGGGWTLLGRVLLMIPGFLSNPTYRWVARNRYRWFGQREFCRLPKPEERGQLLD